MLFSRNNPNLAGDTQQVTIAWNYPFNINGVNYLTEGFADLAGAEGTTVANQLFVPRLLVDAGPLIGMPDKKLWFGIEWQYIYDCNRDCYDRKRYHCDKTHPMRIASP